MSVPSNPFYIDGDFSTPTRISRTPFEYPFRGLGDTTAKTYEAAYVVSIDSFTPTAAGTVDPEAAGFYLLSESKPEIFQGKLAIFRRVYGNIPGTQTDYSTLVINKPAFPTADFNSAWASSTSATATAEIWGATIAATVAMYATGGTFTITYKTSTTAALNYNDSAATIAAAVNALADVVADGFTVTATNQIAANGLLQVADASGAFTPSGSDFSINSASLTPAVVADQTNGAGSATWRIARTALNFNKVGHGLSAAQAIRINTTTTGGGTATTVASVVDADNFTVANGVGNPSAWAYYRKLLRSYTPGTARVAAKLVQSFYLPGVTVGITTPADIPVPAVAINDTQLLTLITDSATGFQTYDADPVAHWPSEESPIYTQTLKKINLDTM